MCNNTYKYYFIYLTDDILFKKYQTSNVSDSQLYAYTDSKKLALAFMEQRKKSIFVIKTQRLTSYQLMQIDSKYPRSYLTELKCTTKEWVDNIAKSMVIPLIVTAFESTMIVSSLQKNIFTDMIRDCYDFDMLNNMKSLKYKYLSSLNYYGFISIFEDESSGMIQIPCTTNDMKYDVLNKVIDLYSDLFDR